MVNSQPDPTSEGQKNVIELTNENFNKLVLENPNQKWVVLIQSPNCIHCQKFKPTYFKIAYDLQKDDIEFGEINCKNQRDLCSQLRINSFPQVLMMNEKKMYKFKQARSELMIKRFIQKDWTTVQSKEIPDTLPTILDNFIDGFQSFKEETQMVFSQEGNYIAKGVFGLILIMILSILLITLYMCFQVCLFFRPVKYPENNLNDKMKKD